MSLKSLPPAIREYFGVFQALRRLGFSADDIYFVHSPENGATAAMLKTQGKEFLVGTGTLTTADGERLNELLEILEREARKSTVEEINKLYKTTLVYKNSLHFMTELLKEGFQMPYKAN